MPKVEAVTADPKYVITLNRDEAAELAGILGQGYGAVGGLFEQIVGVLKAADPFSGNWHALRSSAAYQRGANYVNYTDAETEI